MTLFDDNNASYSDSNTTTLTEQQPASETHSEHGEQSEDRGHQNHDHQDHNELAPVHEEKSAPAASDAFASALESFTTATEEALRQPHALHPPLLHLPATH